MPEEFVPPQPTSRRARKLMVLFLMIWAPISLVLGDRWAESVTFRINDLSSVPGAGSIQRDAEGTFYHVNTDGRARAIYPTLEPPLYAEECLDCRLMTGEQLAQTNDFCAVGVRNQLPAIDFQQPCETWAVLSSGSKAMAFLVFIMPLAAMFVLKTLWKMLPTGKRRSA